MMEWTLEKIFTCDLSSLPVSMLINSFWSSFGDVMPDTNEFLSCMTAHNAQLKTAHKSCQQKLLRICPRRFEANSPKLPMCRDVLWNEGRWHSNASHIRHRAGKTNDAIFTDYFRCVSRFEKVAKDCAKNFLDKPCSTRSIRAVKTVRAPMEVAAKILEKFPNSKVFQLFRDPRGAVRSRTRALWSWGNGESKTIGSHANRYCPNVVKDYQILQSLEVKYPGRTMRVVYDGFVLNAQNITEAMYKVIGKPLPTATSEWLEKHTKEREKLVTTKLKGKVVKKVIHLSNSSAVAVTWKSFYNYEEMQELRDACTEFYRIIDFPWI